MGRFSTIYIAQYSSNINGSDGGDFYTSQALFEDLELLHKLWFQIGELEKRLSGRADDRKNNLVAEFHVLAEKVINQIITIYNEWANGHTKEGWWDRWAFEYFCENPILVRQQGEVDMRPFVKRKLEEQYMNAIDWFDEFKQTEHEHGAVEFLKTFFDKIDKTQINGTQQQLITKAINYEDDMLARQMISELGILRKFYDWSVENGYYAASYDLEDLWGQDWYVDMLQDRGRRDEIIDILETPEALDEAWRQWTQIWPGYEDTLVQVQNILDKLNAVRGTANINQVMSVISLALNVAHNTGLMYEHLDLNEGQMEELSNLDTSPWSKEIKQYSKKILAQYTNPETFMKEPSAVTFCVSAGVVYTAPSFESHMKIRKEKGLMSVELEGRISKERNVCAVWNKGFGDNVYNETIISALNSLYNAGLINNETGLFITGSRISGQSYSQFLKEYEEQKELGNTGNNFSF